MYSEIKQYLCILFKQDSERCFLCDADFRILRMMIIKKKKESRRSYRGDGEGIVGLLQYRKTSSRGAYEHDPF